MIKVLLADDQSLVRSGFRMLIDSADDMETATVSTKSRSTEVPKITAGLLPNRPGGRPRAPPL